MKSTVSMDLKGAYRGGAALQARKLRTQNKGGTVKYLCTFNNTIADVLANRGWKEVSEEEQWDFVWADRDWVYSVFDKVHLENWQRLNHFRNGKELCRKDLMAKNIKKKRRQLEKEGRYEEAATYDFIPMTFMLPREYSIFVEKFKEVGGVWIMKPIGSAQGKGIFMFSRLSEISDWRTDFKSLRNGGKGVEEKDIEAYVVQRYLQQPLLIGGKKFDMRLYTLVTSFSPLKVYTYRRGFARFTNSRYSNDINDIFKHLTNVAIQKTADNYDERTGGKMELQALKMYLMSRYGVERVDALFWEVMCIFLFCVDWLFCIGLHVWPLQAIHSDRCELNVLLFHTSAVHATFLPIILNYDLTLSRIAVFASFLQMQLIMIRALLAVQHTMISDKHCFELYGT